MSIADCVTRIRDVVNDSRLYPYPNNRKWAIQIQHPETGKKRTFYVFYNATWSMIDVDHALTTLAYSMQDGMYQSYESFIAETGYGNESTLPADTTRMLYRYARSLYTSLVDFLPESLLQELEQYAW